MRASTLFLSRLIGWFMILMSLALAARRGPVDEIVPAFLGNPALMLVTGMISVTAGLAIVLVHNRWSGGARTIIVTLVGWSLLLRGMLILILPVASLRDIVGLIRAEEFIYLYLAIWLALGVFLIWPRADQAGRAV